MTSDHDQPQDEPVLPAADDTATEELALPGMTDVEAPDDGLDDATVGATRRSAHPGARRALAAVALVAVGVAGGFGISRATTSQSTEQAAGGPSSGSTGQAPTGNGFGSNNSELPPGFGSGGFGSGSTGSGGFGSGSTGSGGFGSGSTGSGGFGSGSTGSTSSNAADGPTDAATIARNADAGIVDITTTVSGGEAAGTGMVLTSTGEILTNNHVIDGATSISVRDVGNGQTYQATVVGYDRSHDVAVLQLTNASGLTTVKTATVEPSSGAAVVGIGNAGGTGGTPSYAGGAITAVNQSITASDASDGSSERLTGLLATDADIQAGDSGGPLVNISGEVVGMDTAATSNYTFGGDTSGTGAHGYAIAITTALQIATAIESGQSSSTVHIGPTAQLGVYLNGRSTTGSGADVVRVVSGGPAASGGIAAGDVITAIHGTTVSNADDLSAAITRLSPGQTVSVDYTAPSGAHRAIQVTLGTGVPQ